MTNNTAPDTATTLADLVERRFGLSAGAGRDRAATGTLAGMLARRVCRRFRATPIAAETMELVLAAAYSDLREKTDPVRVRENPNFLTLERIKKCPKECV